MWLYHLLTTRVALGVTSKKRKQSKNINPDNQVCELPFLFLNVSCVARVKEEPFEKATLMAL